MSSLDRRRSSQLILDNGPSTELQLELLAALATSSVPHSPATSDDSSAPPTLSLSPANKDSDVQIPEGDTFKLQATHAATIVGDDPLKPKKDDFKQSTPLDLPKDADLSPSPFGIGAEPPALETQPTPVEESAPQIATQISILSSHKQSHTTVPSLLNQKIHKMQLTVVDRIRQRLGIRQELVRATLAELFATGFLVFIGTSVNAQYVLRRGGARFNDWLAVSVGWGLALAFGVQLAFRVSGGHLNPAVSMFQLTQGKISPLRFILFAIAQNVGAFLGALLTYILYWEAIDFHSEGANYFVTGERRSAHVFATYPAYYLKFAGGVIGCFIDQLLGTAVLCLLIACITDRRNRIPPFLQPAFIGFSLTLIGLSIGMNTGFAVNPARDFGPRLLSWFVGYGWTVFSFNNYGWFWIPWIAPMLGAVVGAWIYEFFIGFHIPDDPDTTYIHRIIDDRNPEGNLREIHLIETRPASERLDVFPPQTKEQQSAQQQQPLSYRNL